MTEADPSTGSQPHRHAELQSLSESLKERDRNPDILRSSFSRDFAFARFRNVSTKRVVVFWINYHGVRIRYNVIPPNEFLDVNTFETHPWVLVNADTGDRMLANGAEVFMPVGYKKGVDPWPPERMEVKVTCPMYTLVECCTQVLRDQVSPQQLNTMLIPPLLKRDVHKALLFKRELLGQTRQQL